MIVKRLERRGYFGDKNDAEASSENAWRVVPVPNLCASASLFRRIGEFRRLFVPVLVVEAEHGIGRNQEPVQKIEPEYKIELPGDLVQTARNVADDNQKKKDIAFPGRVLTLTVLMMAKGQLNPKQISIMASNILESGIGQLPDILWFCMRFERIIYIHAC